MCVGRYAEIMELSEAKWNHFEMPATEKQREESLGALLSGYGVIGIYSLFLDELGDFPHEGAKTEFWCEAVLLAQVVEHAVNTVVFHHHHHCGAH